MEPCTQYMDPISALLDGELPEAERLALMEHLTDCDACRAYLEDQTALHGALSSLTAAAPADLAERIMDRVRAEAEPERKKTVPFPAWRRWTALAACCAVVLLGVWALGPLWEGQRWDAATENHAPGAGYGGGAAVAQADAAPAEAAAPQNTPQEAETPSAPAPEEAKEAGESGAGAPAIFSAAPEARRETGDGTQALDLEPYYSEYAAEPAEDKLQLDAGAYALALTTDSPLAGEWIEENLPPEAEVRPWEGGTRYWLTREQYEALRALLLEQGGDFMEAEGNGEEYFLICP